MIPASFSWLILLLGAVIGAVIRDAWDCDDDP
jgi:hypothetical protein